MRAGPVIVATLAMAGIPALCLLTLAGTGTADAGAALLATAVILVAALALAMIWTRDLDLLAETIRQAGEPGPQPPPARYPALAGVEHLAREIERLSRAMAGRTATIERLRRADEAIVERLPDPLIVLDGNRAVRRANAAARAAYGSDMQAVLRHPGLRAAIDRAYATGAAAVRPRAAETAELTLPVPVQREVHATVLVLDPPLADGGQALVMLSDRTREKALDRMRADFVANASHELRTPLASLIGFIDTIRGPAADDPPAIARFLVIMADQAARMNRLMEDLLSLSRIELSEHQPPGDAVDLAAMLPRLADGFLPRAAARDIKLSLTVAPGLPLAIGDAHQIGQVLQNLIENAFKYGREGGSVRVLASASAETGGADARWPSRPGVVVSVADDGIGIAREHLPRLTERFYRVDKGRSRAVGGTGLGLAIVKHIVNRHRGQLLIESEEGVGTTVSVWLPRSGAPLPAEPEMAPIAAPVRAPARPPPPRARREPSSTRVTPEPAENDATAGP